MSSMESQELQDARFGPEALTDRYFRGTPLLVRQEVGRGRFIVASRQIGAGSVVIDALPYVCAVEDELKMIACAHCLKPSIETMERLVSTVIASVDAVLFNERLEAGEDIEIIQRDLAARNLPPPTQKTSEEDDTTLDIAMKVMEELLSVPEPSLLSDGASAASSEAHAVWTVSCQECQQAWYCSEACATENLPLHRLQCGALKKLRHMSWPGSDLTMARTIINILAKRYMESQKKAEMEASNSTPEPSHLLCGGSHNATENAREIASQLTFDFDVMSLVSNEREIAAKTLARRRPLVNFLKKLGSKFPALAVSETSLIVRLIGKVDQNTFGIRYDRNLSYAFGLFPSMSYFNHTCAPNVCVIQNNTVLNIMALRDIQEGEEVAISYIETNRPTKDRRKCLQAEYNFFCRCIRCTAPPSNMISDGFVQEFVCKNPSCDGKGLLIPLLVPTDSGSTSACNICQSSIIIKRT